MRRVALVLGLLASVSWAQDVPIPRPPNTMSQPVSMPVRAMCQPVISSGVLGWSLTGSRPEAYEVRCDDFSSKSKMPILRTRLFAGEPLGIGSITHSEDAAQWRGRRLAVRAYLRAGDVQGWAGLWMRVDGHDGRVLAFDNMQDRPLRGTSSFEWYSVVLEVPEDAARISFGVLLRGPGAVYLAELELSAVDASVPVTDLLGPLRAAAARSSVVPAERTAHPEGGVDVLH